MTDNIRASVLSMFAGDSLALGVHWIYDVEELRRDHGEVRGLSAPDATYHAGKGRGDFTHYGDQAMVLLESVAGCRGFDLDDFFRRWQDLFRDYAGYHDQATKKTLVNIQNGKGPGQCGSPSNDIAGASRTAPLLLVLHNDLDRLVTAARDQALMTHRDPLTIDTAEFFARVAWSTLKGSTPVDAIQATAAMDTFAVSPIAMWVEQGLSSVSRDSLATVVRFGQSCHTSEAFSGIIHLLAKYQDNLEEALVQSVMAGGDNAARAMMVGMVLGAYLGVDALPGEWVSGIRRLDDIEQCMRTALQP